MEQDQARLGELAAAIGRQGDSALLGHEVRGIFVRSPATAGAVEVLLDRGIGHAAATTLIFELGQAGTREAQRALIDVFTNERRSERLRRQALIAVGELSDPQLDTRDAIWQLYRAEPDPDKSKLAPAALLGLGRVGANLRQHPSLAESYAKERDRLLQALGEARGLRSTVIAVEAVGNTKDPSLGSAVAPYLADQAPSVRTAAANALARTGAPAAARELLQRLAEESVIAVRRDVMTALARLDHPSEATRHAVARLLETEGSEAVRAEMQRFLREAS